MLPVTLPREQVLTLMEDASAGHHVEVDLPSQQVVRHDGSAFPFEVDPFRKHCLLNGLDDIGLTMQKLGEIRAFEAERSKLSPWLDGATTRVPRLFPVASLEARIHEVDQSATPGPEQWQ